MLTARQARKQREQLRKQIEREQRAADREKLRRLRDYLRRARRHRRTRIAEIRALCRAARRTQRDRAKEIRRKHRELAKAEVAAMRAADRTACEARTESARVRGDDSIARAARALESEAKHRRTLEIYSRPARLKTSSRGSARRSRQATALHESDAEVIANIPSELHIVWNKLRTRIKESPRRTRTEAFLEWVQENPGEVLSIQEAQFMRDVERAYREQQELGRKLRGRHSYRVDADDPRLERAPSYADAVPF